MLLEQQQLMKWTKIQQKGRLQRWLEDNGITYRLTPAGEVVSTLAWIEKSGLPASGAAPSAPARPQLKKN